jgi:soluble lytic murein transglycosylase
MMIRPCWARNIPDRWRKLPLLAVLAGAALHAGNPDAVARLGAGVAAYERKDYTAAITALKGVGERLPKLADYAGYYLAAAEVESKAQLDVTSEVAPVWSAPVLSPLISKAALVAATGWTAAGKPADAVRVLSDHYDALAQPDGDLALASAYEAAGDLPHAAVFYQHVYYRYPLSDAAAKATAALAALHERLGASFPALAAPMLLLRGDRYLEARDYTRARAEYEAMIPLVSGIEQELARIRLGAADLLRGEFSAANQYLLTLHAAEPEAEAERLYYLEECARQLNDETAMTEAIRRLDKEHARSTWRFRAQVAAANRYLLANRVDDYEPLYEAAAKSFPDEPRAPVCHWKYAWAGYIRRRADAADRLREHLRLFPAHPTAGSALYFLGRLAEDGGDPASARTFYSKLAELFPNYYYGLLASRKLAAADLAGAPAAGKVSEFLSTIAWPSSRFAGAIEWTLETQVRIERAHLLRSAGLVDLAAAELRFGGHTGSQPVPLAIDLARAANSPYLALRAMKSLVPDSLGMPLEGAPQDYWQLLFPLPYKSDLQRNGKAQGLDPYMIAALVRQESEFNPQALSPAQAYGLTQVRPATGRTLARKAGVRRFSSRMLFQPATNLRLGTLYLKMLMEQYGGNREQALAAYNAGKSRANEWQTWATFREPAEFVETIPFTETREYVQAVLRNAELYRKIYGGTAR